MRNFAAALLGGPRFGTARAAGPGRLALAAPWLVVGALMLLAAAAGALHGLAWPKLQGAGVAAAATVLCLLLGLPSACNGPGFWWILPLWLAPSVGLAGWELLPLPAGPASDVLRGAALGLPVMVLLLSGVWGLLPARLGRAAAACGAGPIARARLMIRAAWPGTLIACGVVFLLCWQWSGAARALPR
jgi:hypothetical protein